MMNRNEIRERIGALLPSATPAQRGVLPPNEDTAAVDRVIALWYRAMEIEEGIRHYCFDEAGSLVGSPTKKDLEAAIEAAIEEAENSL